jgi:hypothetical protein
MHLCITFLQWSFNAAKFPKGLNRDEQMSRTMSTSTHNRWMIVMVLILVSAMAQMVSAETAHVATHVVISEFATRGSDSAYDEFVELYNPTNSAIDISGWKLQYWGGSSWSTKLTVPPDTEIPSHRFYLMASSSTYFQTTTADLYHSSYLGFADGSTSSPRGIRIIDSSSIVVDTVVYGGAGGDDDPRGQAEGGKLAPNHRTTANDNSVERKAIASSDENDMAPNGAHHLWGNGEDTDNNGNDFVRQTNGREPQNSASDPENCPAQSWFLSSVSSSYIMYKEDMSKPVGTVTISDGSSEIWKADEAATVDVGFPAGTWTGTLNLDTAFDSGKSFTAEVGPYDGTDFTAYGSQTISGDGGTTYALSISASAFTVPETKYLALQISPSGAALVVKTGGGNSYVTSPETYPGYPVPELPTIILVSAGLLILAGYAYMTKRNK